MADLVIRPAGPADTDVLIGLVRQYYDYDGLDYDEARARGAFAKLFADDRWGCAFLAWDRDVPAGYAVLTHSFSIEFGGVEAFCDELFVVEVYRGGGLGRRLLDTVKAECRARGCGAMHLVVEHHNVKAQAFYAAYGFPKPYRHVLTWSLLGGR